MSLKAFHIVFIALSILLALGFGLWEIIAYAESGRITQLLIGIASIAAAAGLAVYGIRFMKKLKHVGYL